MTDPDEQYDAVGIREGTIVSLARESEFDSQFGEGTEVIDCQGGVVLPGFIDAHTHLESTGKRLVHVDLSETESIDQVVDILNEEAATSEDEWIQGFGWDESAWSTSRYLDSADLDRVSTTRPVVAYRVDMHTAAVNSVAFDRVRDRIADRHIISEDDREIGVIVEDGIDVIRDAIGLNRSRTRRLVTAARDRAHAVGITGVHDKVRDSLAPRVYRDLATENDLNLRVRVDYWSNHLDALIELGIPTNAGDQWVQTGAIKSFSDGSIGAQTAKLSQPFAGQATEADDNDGLWVVNPDSLQEIVQRADKHAYQLTIHAIGDTAVRKTVDILESTAAPQKARHRIEHVELIEEAVLDKMAAAGLVASCQPNFLKWTEPGGLYEERLGRERADRSNRFRDFLESGVHLAFGSDCMPMDPLAGIHHTVTASEPAQRLDVTEAIRAYTRGAAFAGHDEDRLGTLEVGTAADLVVLGSSPWENPTGIRDIDVQLTIVDGAVVFSDDSIRTKVRT